MAVSVSDSSVESASAVGESEQRSLLVWHHALAVWLVRLVAAMVVIGSWQLLAATHLLDPVFTGEPSIVVQRLITNLGNGSILQATGQTLEQAAIGYTAAVVAGLAIAVLFINVKVINDAFQPLLTALNSVPRIALAPLFVLWFGIAGTQNIALAFSFVFFIVVANALAGFGLADRDHVILAQTIGMPRHRLFMQILLPTAVPSLFAGLQLGLVYAILGTVSGEMLSGSTGLGNYVSLEMSTFHVNSYFAALIFLSILTVAVSSAMRVAEKRLLRWRSAEVRGTRFE